MLLGLLLQIVVFFWHLALPVLLPVNWMLGEERAYPQPGPPSFYSISLPPARVWGCQGACVHCRWASVASVLCL